MHIPLILNHYYLMEKTQLKEEYKVLILYLFIICIYICILQLIRIRIIWLI